MHERFEWSSRKARENLARHGVDFAQDAAPMLVHRFAPLINITEFDALHQANEDRWITTGPHPDDPHLLLRVVWTERMDDEGLVTRLITARLATPNERRRYEQEILRRQQE